MLRKLSTLVLATAVALAALAADPTATRYTLAQCRGTLSLYPASIPEGAAAYPDSLTPVFINHVGRHGSRFPASQKPVARLTDAIAAAREAGTLTDRGKELEALARRVVTATAGQWGALDSLGMAEERAIASRMYRAYPELFKGGRVEAISSYAPRCLMSMYTFTHQLARLNNDVEIATQSGRQYSYLLRPFDVDAEYKSYRQDEAWRTTLAAFEATAVTLEPLKRCLGARVDALDPEEARSLALDMYRLVAGAPAAGVAVDEKRFFTDAEANSLWQAENLRHYLLYSSSTLSTIPADMASPLVMNLSGTMDAVAQGSLDMPTVMLRFGHAETLMPLLALLRLSGCYYMSNYFDTVATHWRDFDIAPMAANLQMVLFKAKGSGRYYVKTLLNERPVPLLPGSDVIYTPWEQAREYLNRCIPIFYH